MSLGSWHVAAVALTRISAYSTHGNLAVHKIMEAIRKKKELDVNTSQTKRI